MQISSRLILYLPQMYANRRNIKETIGSEKTMVTADFRPEVKIRPFRA